LASLAGQLGRGGFGFTQRGRRGCGCAPFACRQGGGAAWRGAREGAGGADEPLGVFVDFASHSLGRRGCPLPARRRRLEAS
jgi:hypothetical protein